MLKKELYDKGIQFFVYAVITSLLLGSLLTLHYGTDNLRMLLTFSSDGPVIVGSLLHNFTHHNIVPTFFFYGYIYNEIAFVICWFYKLVHFNVDVRFMTNVLRFVAFASYAGCGVVAYFLFLEFAPGKKVLALFCGAILLAMPMFAFWSAMTHPDTLQTLFMLLAGYFAFRRGSTSMSTILGAMFAGFAFGTKYGGIFILPFVALPTLIYLNIERFALKKSLLTIVWATFVFLASWLITNPFVIGHFSRFWRDTVAMQGMLTKGMFTSSSLNPFTWIPVIERNFGQYIMLFLFVMFLFFLGFLVNQMRLQGLRECLRSQKYVGLLSMVLYVLVIGMVFFFLMRARSPRYLFLVLPFFIIAGMLGLSRLLDKFNSPWVGGTVSALLLLLLLRVVFLDHTYALLSRGTYKYNNYRLIAAKFISNHFANNTVIWADQYSYMPSSYKNFKTFWFFSVKKIPADAKVLVLSQRMTGRFCWIKPGTMFSQGQIVGRHSRYTKAAGVCNNLRQFWKSYQKDWKVIYEVPNLVVFQRLTPATNMASSGKVVT